MENVPTAKEFLIESRIAGLDADKIIIEFAKLHIEACKEEIAEKVGLSYKNCVLNSYPLTNIK